MTAPKNIQGWLPLVEKPARYVGGERGAHPADTAEQVRIVLAFPDVYEIGMSNKGLLFLYEILNDIEGVTAERAFLAGPDMATQMRVRGAALYSLETGRPVSDADVLGVSVPSAVNFTGMLSLLGSAGIPLLRTERTDEHPIVIAGGHSVFNAAPILDFCDAIAVGEGDELIVDIAETMRICNEADASRLERLKFLSQISGLYVPGVSTRNVKKRVVADLSSSPHPGAAIVPHIEPIHDRIAMEVARGCVKGCRFCQAGMVTRPYREREPDELLTTAKSVCSATGNADFSLLSLNAADYNNIIPLLSALQNHRVDASISLPALRLDDYKAAMSGDERFVKTKQQTFAPEAGTQRLRTAINKPITDDEILEGVRAAGESGVQRIKLYFIIGLPGETDEDVIGIADIAQRADAALKKGLGRFGKITVNVTPFIPQPHTPYQWSERLDNAELKRRIKLIKTNLSRKIDFKCEKLDVSLLEAALVRGGNEIAPVILNAYLNGARMDGWSEHFRFKVWRDAFAKYGMDIEEYATRAMPIDNKLPWDFIDVGITGKFLRRELNKGTVTEPCLDGECSGCGVCTDSITNRRAANTIDENAYISPPDPTGKVMRVRFNYCKEGVYRFLSHLDLQRLLHLALRRADLPIAMSEGFSPRPKVEAAPPLPVGVEGENEWCDIYLYIPKTIDDISAALRSVAGEFAPGNFTEIPLNAKSLQQSVKLTEWSAEFWTISELTLLSGQDVLTNIKRRIARKNYLYEGRKGEVDAGPNIEEATVHAGVFQWKTIVLEDGRLVNPLDFIASMGDIPRKIATLTKIKRISVG